MVVGVLALQGDFAEHIGVLEAMAISAVEVRSVASFQHCDALILPGGESTTIKNLLSSTGLDNALKQSQKPMFGTCAGAILLADLGKIDIKVERNAYGRQLDSFRATLDIGGEAVSTAFIRAPKIISVGPEVEILASHNHDPVLVQQGNILAATFHTELDEKSMLHHFFLKEVL